MGRRGQIALWVAGNAACAVLVALPDADNRLFSISDLHGPSPLDAIGAAGLALLWVPVLVATLRAAALEQPAVRAGLAVSAACLVALLAVTVLGDLGWWWVPPAVGLAGLQLVVLARSWRAAPAG